MTTLLLVRHGSTAWTAERRLQGRTDISLDERGREESVRLRAIVERWAPTTLLVSPAARALETAMGAYNAFVGSLESQVLTSAKRFEALNIDTGGKTIETLPMCEQAARPLTKLAVLPDAAE